MSTKFLRAKRAQRAKRGLLLIRTRGIKFPLRRPNFKNVIFFQHSRISLSKTDNFWALFKYLFLRERFFSAWFCTDLFDHILIHCFSWSAQSALKGPASRVMKWLLTLQFVLGLLYWYNWYFILFYLIDFLNFFSFDNQEDLQLVLGLYLCCPVFGF